MGDNKPESQSFSLQVWETARWESSASHKEGSPEPGGQQGGQSPQPSGAEPPVACAKGDHVVWSSHTDPCVWSSAVWSSAVSAAVWSLPRLHLESGVLHSSGSFQ